jgi:hypothetical protein
MTTAAFLNVAARQRIFDEITPSPTVAFNFARAVQHP